MTEFEKAYFIIEKLQNHGHEAIIVGGWVSRYDEMFIKEYKTKWNK